MIALSTTPLVLALALAVVLAVISAVTVVTLFILAVAVAHVLPDHEVKAAERLLLALVPITSAIVPRLHLIGINQHKPAKGELDDTP
jgi:hypothetical protein